MNKEDIEMEIHCSCYLLHFIMNTVVGGCREVTVLASGQRENAWRVHSSEAGVRAEVAIDAKWRDEPSQVRLGRK